MSTYKAPDRAVGDIATILAGGGMNVGSAVENALSIVSLLEDDEYLIAPKHLVSVRGGGTLDDTKGHPF